MGRITRTKIEEAQREAGKRALEQPALNILYKFIGRELGCSVFEAREAECCISPGSWAQKERWPKKVLHLIEVPNLKTRAFQRANELSRSYEFGRWAYWKDPRWRRYNSEPETLELVIMDCKESDQTVIGVRKRIGPYGESTSKMVDYTKRMLERWGRMVTRGDQSAPTVDW